MCQLNSLLLQFNSIASESGVTKGEHNYLTFNRAVLHELEDVTPFHPA